MGREGKGRNTYTFIRVISMTYFQTRYNKIRSNTDKSRSRNLGALLFKHVSVNIKGKLRVEKCCLCVAGLTDSMYIF